MKDRIEEILKNRIKFIGENEQTYTGNPNDLIEELTKAVLSEVEGLRKEKPKFGEIPDPDVDIAGFAEANNIFGYNQALDDLLGEMK